MELVFSDEFNTPGRTFWPGDDPYWEAVDLHYWQMNNLEWYDPAAITTQDGYLVITLSQKETHSLNYQGVNVYPQDYGPLSGHLETLVEPAMAQAWKECGHILMMPATKASHPGPMHADGTFVGRVAPEIDMFEAQITGEPLTGQVSQPAQWGVRVITK
ncbi:beta-glucan synthesis-associated protein-domain-containing protein [Suillus subluteus]|nr:beta-glucan synthesis-associated protein-domain-containing protein [Suillus subluteus]